MRFKKRSKRIRHGDMCLLLQNSELEVGGWPVCLRSKKNWVLDASSLGSMARKSRKGVSREGSKRP